MSNLVYIDTEIEFLRLTLQRKDGTGSATYQIGTDFWASGSIYATNDPVYPVLVRAPEVRRGLGGEYVAARYDFNAEIFAKADLDEFGKSFADLRQDYEFYNASVEVRYYPKPSGTTISPANNTRQIGRVVDVDYDDETGIMSLQCRDTWYQDKELNKRLTADIFPDVEAVDEGEIGSIVFGEAATVADGIAIDAPVLTSSIDGSNRPVAKIFTGWTFGSAHLNNAFKRLLVRNPYPEVDTRNWVPVHLPADPQAAIYGDATISAPTEPSNYAVDLSRYSRAQLFTPSGGANILTAVRCALAANTNERCADVGDGEILIPEDATFLSRDDSFTVECWVRFDALHDAGARRYILQQGADGESIEWGIYFGTTNDQLKFSVWGTTEKTVTWGSAASTGTWYHLIAYYDSAGDAIGLIVNNGTAVTTTTIGTLTRMDGKFYVGGEDSPGFDGRIRCIRYWDRVLDSTARTSLYNSGEGKTTDRLTDAERVGLDADWPLNEPLGLRESYRGGSPLIERTGAIGYNYSEQAVTVDNSHGELSVTVWRAETKDGGDTYTPIGNYLARSTIDLTTAAIQSGTTDAYFQFDPPVVLLEGVPHLIALEWSNRRTNSYYIKARYAAGSGSHYARDERSETPNWVIQSGVDFGMALYVVGKGDDDWEDGTTTGSNDYSYQHLEAKAITLSTGQSHQEFAPALQFKVGLSGLEDDGGGTYTGGAYGLIKYPADILRFMISNSSFGVNAASMIDSTSFNNARTKQTTAGLACGFALRGPINADDFAVELCRQGRMRLYKLPAGTLGVDFAQPANTIEFTLSEPALRDDCELLAAGDSSESSLVNEFKQSFAVDILEVKKDISLVRTSGTEKYSGFRQITATASTDGDTGRQALCSSSQTLYGKKETKEPFDFYDSDTPAKLLQNFLCDRYTKKQRVAVVRLPRARYYLSGSVLALFSKVNLQHTGLETSSGAGIGLKVDDGTGSPITVYDSEGVSVSAWAGGSLVGEVVQIVESGPYITATIHGLPPFNEV